MHGGYISQKKKRRKGLFSQKMHLWACNVKRDVK